jgi:type I restriction enzyme S subunit
MGDDVLKGTQDKLSESAVLNSAAKLVPKGSVAVVVRSGILNRTIPVALVPFSTTLNQDMKAIIPGSGVTAEWLAWGLRAFEQQLLAETRKAGTTVASIEFKRLLDFELPVPPLEEQRCIVAILEDHLSHLDTTQVSLTTADRRATAMIKQILVSAIPEPNAYPTTWAVTTVGEAGMVELGRQRHPDWHTGCNMRPYLRVANVFENRLDLTDVMEMHWPGNSFDRFQLQPGDLLLNEGQSPHLLGRPAIYRGDPPDVAFTNSLLRFQAGDGVLPEFALLVFRRHMHAGRFARESRITTNLAHLSASRLKAVEFPLPPLREQKRMVDEMDGTLLSVTKCKHDIGQTASKGQALRRSLLAAAFRGDLTADWRANHVRTSYSGGPRARGTR